MKRVIFVASTLILSACSSMGADHGGMMMGRSAAPAAPLGPPTPAADAYMRAAGESDLYEVTSSQLALQRTQNPEVRRFATQMIDHHTGTTNALLAAAAMARQAPPPAVLGPQKRALINQLQAQVGVNFDRLYVQQQAAAHAEALGIHTAYAGSGDVPQIRAAAAAAVPVVQRHLNEVQALGGPMGAAAGM